MKWILPGTVLEAQREEAELVAQQFFAMFLAGGMVLSQVASITGLEAYTIQNWVKRGFLTPPVRKRYSMEQVCRIINLNALKSVLPMERICGLMTYINGHLDDESDDLIDDTALYFLFVSLAARLRQMDDPQALEDALEEGLRNYREPVPGAKERVENTLRIMLTAWVAVRMKQEAERMLDGLYEKGE